MQLNKIASLLLEPTSDACNTEPLSPVNHYSKLLKADDMPLLEDTHYHTVKNNPAKSFFDMAMDSLSDSFKSKTNDNAINPSFEIYNFDQALELTGRPEDDGVVINSLSCSLGDGGETNAVILLNAVVLGCCAVSLWYYNI